MRRIRPQATCHPDRPHRSLGLCNSCYFKQKVRPNPSRDRNSFLKRNYGITLEEYNGLLKKQNGGCAICGAKPKTRSLNVDHNHKTMWVRGLLCHLCNRALGQLKADTRPNIGLSIDLYLKENS